MYTIISYGHPERLIQRAPASLEAAVFFSGIIAACGMCFRFTGEAEFLMRGAVQSFFSFRIYALSNQLFIPCVTWALSLVRLVLSTVAFISGLQMVEIASYEAQWGWLAITLWSISAANDLTIAATLVYILARRRKNIHQR
jgi:hypothetical protein